MELKACTASRYRDGYCWSCSRCLHVVSVRVGSVLYNHNITFCNFLHLLWIFCNGTSVADSARILSMNEKTVRSLYKSLRQCMAEDFLEGGSAQKNRDRDILLKSMSRSLGNASTIAGFTRGVRPPPPPPQMSAPTPQKKFQPPQKKNSNTPPPPPPKLRGYSHEKEVLRVSQSIKL